MFNERLIDTLKELNYWLKRSAEGIVKPDDSPKKKKKVYTQEELETPLTFQARVDGTEIFFLTYDSEETRTVEVSTDGGKTWNEFESEVYDEGNNTPIATLDAGEKALVRGDNPNGFGLGDDDYCSAGYLYISGEAYVYGNIMSLLSKEDFASMKEVPEYAFASLFVDYDNFEWNNAESLFSHPSKKLLLPATTLAEGCYSRMFYGCTGLAAAPELPATTLADSCYDSMFQGCTRLNYIKALFTTTPSNTYTRDWVKGVSSTGTFVKNSAATWNVTGNNGVPTGWTVETASE